jgi:hypothetical protein
VERGELIAYSGNTGASTGPHLHMEVRRSARWGDTVDPMPYFQAEETPEPVKPEPVEIPKPLPPGVPINKPEPVRPKPKWEPSAALARGFNRIQEGSQMTEEHNDTTTVKVSMRDIYQEVQRQGKLLEQIASSLPTQESKVEDHENRIRKLEQRMWQVIGIFGFLAAIVSPLVAVMTR